MHVLRHDIPPTLLLLSLFALFHSVANCSRSKAACQSAAEPQKSCNLTDIITCDDPNGNDAWPPHEATLLSALFSDITQLQDAWESHPLLSKITFARAPDRPRHSGDVIPTVFHNRSCINFYPESLRTHPDTHVRDPTFDMFTLEDVTAVLSRPLVHGSDYKLVKKIVLEPPHEFAGEEYMGMLPKPQYSMEEIMRHFHYGGFSLVIDKMHRRWRKIAHVARCFEEQLGLIHVGANLYLTPEVLDQKDGNGESQEKNKGVRQGFESHWDWMDVIVIQLLGRKRWHVAKEATVYLSNRDQKRKPTKQEANYFATYGHYYEFTLCPGDVLYIPRGFMHNASTIDFRKHEFQNSKKGREWDDCPTYPKNSLTAQNLKNRVSGPSLHLTFGLEHSCEGTFEALIHHALYKYSTTIQTKQNNVQSLPTIDCGDGWIMVWHLSLAEVARRSHEHSKQTCSGVDHGNSDSAILRQSIPLFLHTSYNGYESISDNEKFQYLKVKQQYQKALQEFFSTSSQRYTANFVTLLVTPPINADSNFCFPGYSFNDVIQCHDDFLVALESAEVEEYLQHLYLFIQYALEHFDEAIILMDNHGIEIQKRDRARQELELLNAGEN